MCKSYLTITATTISSCLQLSLQLSLLGLDVLDRLPMKASPLASVRQVTNALVDVILCWIANRAGEYAKSKNRSSRLTVWFGGEENLLSTHMSGYEPYPIQR